ncbi:Mg-chelatase subunits D/I family, ComM subfamily protein [Pseudomonas chlororaphis subsp. aurantiaca]|nr:Mg-chelatase subunits D/I family, ComM subfamily protein [Pseudomonas chlororaphis subsp. aurantiaca]
MSLAIVHSRAQTGVQAPAVSVEVHLANGLPALTLVGLPEAAVKESKDRVRSAILNAGFDFPARRITLNLAPADLPKDGGRFDLELPWAFLPPACRCRPWPWRMSNAWASWRFPARFARCAACCRRPWPRARPAAC